MAATCKVLKEKTSISEHSVGIKRRAPPISNNAGSALNASQRFGTQEIPKLYSTKIKNIQKRKSDFKPKFTSMNGRSLLSHSATETDLSASYLRLEQKSRREQTGLPMFTSCATPTVLRMSQSLQDLIPIVKKPVEEMLTVKAQNWYECEFEVEGGWIDEEEQKLFEETDWGKPIVFDDATMNVDFVHLQSALQNV